MKKLCLLIICLPILALSQINITNECYRSSNKSFRDSLLHEMLILVNQHRINHNIHKIVWDKQMQPACKKHSMYQAYEGGWTHGQTNKKNPYYFGRMPWDRSLIAQSENVAFHYYFNSKDYNPWNSKIKNAKEIAFDIFTGWKKSPPHNENMLDKNWNYMAFDYYGYVSEKHKYYDYIHATQLFR